MLQKVLIELEINKALQKGSERGDIRRMSGDSASS